MNEPTTWIPVAERLPEPGTPLILATKYGEVISAFRSNDPTDAAFLMYSGGRVDGVTHWQPLPPPPPKPDAFETWWISQDGGGTNTTRIRSEQGESCLVYHSVARMIWDAAIASTKQ